MDIVKKETHRGFVYYEFADLYGAKCSLQESSLATDDAIWFGVDKDYDGDEVERGRMHLNREQVEALLSLLESFVRRGDLRTDEEWGKMGEPPAVSPA
jgi:hypothetical protein